MKKVVVCIIVAALMVGGAILPLAQAFALPELTDSYASREWKFANTGSNATGSFKVESDGVSITSDGGKFADSEEGFSFYYTEVDAAKENFVLTATITVTAAQGLDNQSALGLVVTDTVGVQNTGKYMNYVASGCFKLSGGYGGYRVPGARYVTGYIDPQGLSPTENLSGEGVSVRDCDMTKAFYDAPNATASFDVGSSYTFTLRKSNSGYHCLMAGSEKEYIFYGVENLLLQDTQKVYVGFFAARHISVKVSNISFASIDPKLDDPKVEAPVETIPLKVSILSSTTRGQLDYTYSMKANASGVFTLTDSDGKVWIDNQRMEAEQIFTKTLSLPDKNMVVFRTRFYPDSKLLAPTAEQTIVYYSVLPNVKGVVYASPDVESGGKGTKNSPVSLYDAFKYALPGYTIIIPNGNYKMRYKFFIERGVSGTEAEPIILRAETAGQVTLDCSEMVSNGESFWVAGDYWHIYGLNLCNAPRSCKGIRISGNNNVLEMCQVYDCTNTGIQISGNSKETKDLWPSNNLVKNCTSHNNCDTALADADGFGVKLTVGTGNVLYGCIAYNNIDDGYDLYAKSVTGSIGSVLIENCVAYNNGFLNETMEQKGEGNGFKLGGESLSGKHRLVNCVAYGNGAKGITSNSCPDDVILNCTSYGNNRFDIAESVSLYTKMAAQTTEYVVEGLLSMQQQAKPDKFAVQKQAELYSESNYVWDGSKCVNSKGATADDSWFVSVDMNIMPTRNADGTINMNGLLVLTSSAAVDTGARIDTSAKSLSIDPYVPNDTNVWAWLIPCCVVAVVAVVVVVISLKVRKNKLDKQA